LTWNHGLTLIILNRTKRNSKTTKTHLYSTKRTTRPQHALV